MMLKADEKTRAGGPQVRCGKDRSDRILVVDDEIPIRKMSMEVLTRCGYHVDGAEDGAAAWEALQAGCYDLLITDNKMPKVSGLELVQKLRSANLTLPVVLMSGALPTEALNRNPSLQLAATLPKPFTGDALLGTVVAVLSAAVIDDEQVEPAPLSGSQPSAHCLTL